MDGQCGRQSPVVRDREWVEKPGIRTRHGGGGSQGNGCMMKGQEEGETPCNSGTTGLDCWATPPTPSTAATSVEG